MTADPAKLSLLDQVAKRAQEIRDSTLLDLPVPKWEDPQIVVRYRPATNKEVVKHTLATAKAKEADLAEVALDASCDLLIVCCVGVFARFPDDPTEYSLRQGDPEGDLTRFDPPLAAALDLSETATARQTVRALFITEGAIGSAAVAITQFSDYRETEASETIAGE